jgi:hypothetical protein
MRLVFSRYSPVIQKINAYSETAASCLCIFLIHTQLNCFLFDLSYFYCALCFYPFWKFGMQVDLVEPVSHFLEAARENLTGCMDQGEDSHKAANFYCVPLQVVLIDRDRSLDIL